MKYPVTWREVTTKEGVQCLLDGIMVIEKGWFSFLFNLVLFLRIMFLSNKGKNNCDQAKHEYI